MNILIATEEALSKTQVSTEVTFSEKTPYESNSSNSLLMAEKVSYQNIMNQNNTRMLVPAAGSEKFSSIRSTENKSISLSYVLNKVFNNFLLICSKLQLRYQKQEQNLKKKFGPCIMEWLETIR